MMKTTNALVLALVSASIPACAVDADAPTTTEAAELSAASSGCASLATADFDRLLALVDAGLASAASDVAACDETPSRCTDPGRTTYEQSLLETARASITDGRRVFVEAFHIVPANASWYVIATMLDAVSSLQSAAVTSTLSATRNANPTAARAVHEQASQALELAADLRARAGRCYMGI